MDKRLIAQALHDQARKDIPDDMNLWNEVQERLGGVPQRAVRSRLTLVVAVILALLAMSAIAYAAARLLQNQPLDPGLQGASEADLVTTSNQKQTIDGVSVTLDYAYADSNRISVSLSSEGTLPTGYTYTFGDLTVSDDAGHVFQSMFGGGGGGGGGGGDSSVASYTLSTIGSYDASIITTMPDKITLRIEGTINLVSSPPAQTDQPVVTTEEVNATQEAPAKVIGPFVYNVMIPFIHGQIVEPHQTAMAKGITMRLDRLVIAPSLTRGVICIDPAPDQGYQPLMSLTVKGASVTLDPVQSFNPPPDGSPVGCYDLQINQSLYQRVGQWRLSIDSLMTYLPVGYSSGSNGTTYDYSIDGMPDALAQVRAKLEPALQPYHLTLTETDGSLKFSFPANSTTIDPSVIDAIVGASVREETPGPWVFTFDVPRSS